MKLELGRSPSGVLRSVDLRNYSNSHVCVFGKSGTGKTTLLQRCLAQVPSQGCHAVVFGAGQDWFRQQGSGKELTTTAVRSIQASSMELSFNPLHPHSLPNGEAELPFHIGIRVAAALREASGLREPQELYLANAVTTYLCSASPPHTVGGFITFLEHDAIMAKDLKTSIHRLIHLSNAVNCGVEHTNWQFCTPGLTLLDFSDIPTTGLQALISELIIQEIIQTRMSTPEDWSIPLVLVIDECQRFRFREGGGLDRLLREGRKYGLSGWFASQNLTQATAVDALGNAALRIQFAPVDNQIRKLAKSMARGDRKLEQDLLAELPALQRGQFFYRDEHGQLLKVAADRPAG